MAWFILLLTGSAIVLAGTPTVVICLIGLLMVPDGSGREP